MTAPSRRMLALLALVVGALGCTDSTAPAPADAYALTGAPVFLWRYGPDSAFMVADTLRFAGGGSGSRSGTVPSAVGGVTSVDSMHSDFRYRRTDWQTLAITWYCPPNALCAAATTTVILSGDELTLRLPSQPAITYHRVRWPTL